MRKRILPFCLVIGLLSSCGESEQTTQNLQTEVYFDIKGFFEEEAVRLSGNSNPVHKEITRNREETESKNITIKDWKKELSLFIESDINKPAWTSSYQVREEGDSTVYITSDPNLRTKKIVINMEDEKVAAITISNEVTNQLYTSQEKLYYSPDSLYRIEKEQDVRVIGSNQYLVTGKFK